MQVHPQQVSPGEAYDVFYFLRNHTDAGTYYIQGKTYDVKTGEVLDTFALAQSATNSRLFLATRQAPPDPVGYGRSIVTIATVYTDSGFTAKSENYEEQEQYFLVKGAPLFAGGGGTIDITALAEAVAEHLKKGAKDEKKTQNVTKVEKVNLDFVESLFGSIGALQREINRIPKEALDLRPIKEQIADLKAVIGKRPEFEATDLSTIEAMLTDTLDAISALETAIKTGNAHLIQLFEAKLSAFGAQFETSIGAKIDESIQSQEIELPMTMRVKGRSKEAAPAADPLEAIKHLTGA